MKESQPIPAIAVSLATSLVAAPYLLIRNYLKENLHDLSYVYVFMLKKKVA